jgi:hypothetical protein
MGHQGLEELKTQGIIAVLSPYVASMTPTFFQSVAELPHTAQLRVV